MDAPTSSGTEEGGGRFRSAEGGDHSGANSGSPDRVFRSGVGARRGANCNWPTTFLPGPRPSAGGGGPFSGVGLLAGCSEGALEEPELGRRLFLTAAAAPANNGEPALAKDGMLVSGSAADTA
mmetsp:Transcript_11172/g.31218  ORF Transcript_11172/g.31218 Transcript_11172/m.31218 type:complete len:123 (-) Transcript_11172:180-548(-)